jgi:hypothetical protein
MASAFGNVGGGAEGFLASTFWVDSSPQSKPVKPKRNTTARDNARIFFMKNPLVYRVFEAPCDRAALYDKSPFNARRLKAIKKRAKSVPVRVEIFEAT